MSFNHVFTSAAVMRCTGAWMAGAWTRIHRGGFHSHCEAVRLYSTNTVKNSTRHPWYIFWCGAMLTNCSGCDKNITNLIEDSHTNKTNRKRHIPVAWTTTKLLMRLLIHQAETFIQRGLFPSTTYIIVTMLHREKTWDTPPISEPRGDMHHNFIRWTCISHRHTYHMYNIQDEIIMWTTDTDSETTYYHCGTQQPGNPMENDTVALYKVMVYPIPQKYNFFSNLILPCDLRSPP